MKWMLPRKLVLWVVLGVMAGSFGLAGCSQATVGTPTTPPSPPSHKIAGSVLPAKVADYSVLGAAPVAGQLTATYARDAEPLDLAVVTFDPTGEFGQTELTDDIWYDASRCGILWKGDVKTTPRPQQAACITVLTDGVMTTVSGGAQTPTQLAGLANAIYAQLA